MHQVEKYQNKPLNQKYQDLGILTKVLVEQHKQSGDMYTADKVLELLLKEHNELEL